MTPPAHRAKRDEPAVVHMHLRGETQYAAFAKESGPTSGYHEEGNEATDCSADQKGERDGPPGGQHMPLKRRIL